MRERRSTYLFSAALLASTALSLPSVAQAATPAPNFTDTIDDHGVDLTTGLPFVTLNEGGIGSGPGHVAVERTSAEGAGWADNWTGGVYSVTSGGITKMYVYLGGKSATFSGSGTSWRSDKADGTTLTVDAQGFWNFIERDGTVVKFDVNQADEGAPSTASPNCPGADEFTCRVPLSITRPDGLKFTLTWDVDNDCSTTGSCPTIVSVFKRLTNVSSSAGYSVAFAYAATGTASVPEWFERVSATFNNSANPPASAPTITYAYPSSTEIDATDPAGRKWVFTLDTSGRLTGIERPGSASNNISYAYGADGTVSSSTKDGVTYTYSRSLAGTIATETRTDPLTHTRVVTADTNVGRPSSDQDELGHTTGYQYDANGRLTQVTAPEGNAVQYGYDLRGNVTTATNVAKTNSGLANIVTSASYDVTCSNIVTCNKPNSTTDAKGNVTNYTYDPTHGGVLTVTQPAPATGGVRPQTRFSYTQVTSASSDLVYVLTGVSACQTTASCTGAADETKGSAAYNSNLLPTSITRQNGTGTLSTTRTMTYTPTGDLDTLDGPLAGTADTTKYRYDADDNLVGVTSPDPDGTGAMIPRAIRLTYRPNGQISKEEIGTVTDQTDVAWANFAPKETVDVTFDGNSRVVQQKLSSGTTAYALNQTSYDSLGRANCTAVRMSPAAAPPASACTVGTTGDQISQLAYDPAGQVTQQLVGVGSAAAATERTLTYSNNGLVASLKDGDNNVTTYSYDGFDRLSKTQYPSPTQGAGTSSTTDFEQLGYDANSNVTSRRLRDGNSILFTYDNLNRPTLKDLPGTEPSVSYAYDNLGRVTSASETGNSMSYTYDALSRKLTEVGPQGTVTSGYDLAGRRTGITYPGSPALTITTTYLTTGEVSTIKDGTTALATYAYDNLGNRTSATFGNGVATTYAYDPISRLTTLTHSLAGTTNDLTIGALTYNAASQITSAPRSNSVYSWTGATALNRNYTANGLNQYTAAGTATFSYDTKGNLTSDGTNTFGYSSENLLTSATVGGVSNTLSYDPWLRLTQVAGTTTSRFAYDGINILADYDGTNALQHRYVFGPGVDEPIVEYSSTGVRTYLSSDERGSIVARSSATGALSAANTYDEYGIPGSGNAGLFQYTGQVYLPQVGMYYYKNRFYSTTLGRFMQTDPIGPADNANLYAYVHNDPINNSDPLGLTCVGDCSPIDVISTFIGVGLGDGGGEEGGAGAPSGPQVGDLIQKPCVGNCTPIFVTAQRKSKPLPLPLPPGDPGKPDQCLTIRHQIGEQLDDLGRFLQRSVAVGGTLATIASAAEGGGLATALFSIRLYGYVTGVRTAAALLLSDPRTPISDALEKAIGHAAGADPIGHFIAGQVMGIVNKYTQEPDSCHL